MGWEHRGGVGRYFTRTRRRGGRVIREYVGRGAVVEVVAMRVEAERAEREAKRVKLVEEREAIGKARDASTVLDRHAKMFLHEAMRQAGFRQHARSHWRKSRMTWLEQEDDDDDPLIMPDSGPRRESMTTEQLWAFLHGEPIPPPRSAGSDFAGPAAEEWISLITGPDPLAREALETRLRQFREGLGVSESTLEQVLVEQLTVAWLESLHFNTRAAECLGEDATDSHREFLAKGADRAARKFAFLSKQLLTIRRLLRPAAAKSATPAPGTKPPQDSPGGANSTPTCASERHTKTFPKHQTTNEVCHDSDP